MMEAGRLDPGRRGDTWAVGLFVLHVSAALALIPFFPGQVADPDLYAYFLYFRDIVSRAGDFRGIEYLNHPKPLMILLPGSLGNPLASAVVTALVSGALGSTVYLIGRRAFGVTAGVIWSLLLLADPTRAFLALKSGADLYLAFLLFLAILLVMAEKPGRASIALFLAALIKPVVLPCAAQFLLGPCPPARRLRHLLIPFLALPVTFAMNRLISGSVWLPGTYLAEFSALRGNPGIGALALPGFIFWQVLVENRFGLLMAPALLGMLMWSAGGSRRILSPLLVMPGLFAAGYLGLALVSPYIPFFRFFWPLEVWILGFIAYAAARAWEYRGPHGRLLAAGLAAALIALSAAQSAESFARYRATFALPMERDRAAARDASEILGIQLKPGESVLCPLGLQPFLTWHLSAKPRLVVSAEGAARKERDSDPDWIVDIPASYLNPAALKFVNSLKQSGLYGVCYSSAEGAVYRKRAADGRGAPK